MKKRYKLDRRSSKRMFSRSAQAVHRRNIPRLAPMRGGIRS